jgi:molybdopterin synthase sulfur carrier subunit
MPKVFIPPQMRDLTDGTAEIEVPGATVGEVVDGLEARFPGLRDRLCADDQLAPALQVSVDHVMTNRGLRARVQPNSEVHFLPAFGGG